MDNESMSNAYFPINYDGSSESAFTDQSACQPLTDTIQDSNPIELRPVSIWDGGHTPECANQVDQYLNADFEPDYSFADLVQFEDDPLSNDEWSQYLAPDANHNQNCEDHGNMSWINPMDVIGNSFLDAVDNDQPESSLATSFHPVTYPETQAAHVQCPEPTSSGTSAPSSTRATSFLPCDLGEPSSTRATSFQPYSPVPETAGQIPNASVDGSRYTCNYCRVSPKTKRDWDRHLETNKHKARGNLRNGSSDNGIPGAAASTGFHCPVEGCKYHSSTGRAITREDNLRRHVKMVHGMDMGRNREE